MKREMMRQSLNPKKGFTIIELMVVLVILGTLVAAGVPGMQTLLANNSVRSTSDRLVNSLAYARGEAVARVATVGVCSSDDGVDCGGAWSAGWIVWADQDNDGAFDAPERIRVESISITGLGLTGGAVNFNQVGENTTGADVVFNITKTSATPRALTVDETGYVSVQ